MARKKKEEIPRLIVPKNATLKQIYAIAREQFTAVDLQKYTVNEPMVPAEQVLAEMEKIHLQESRKPRKNAVMPPSNSGNRYSSKGQHGRMRTGKKERALKTEQKMRRYKKDDIPRLIVPKNATLKQMYAKYRESFTAADLQKYTVDEPMVPMEQVLAEMEKIHLRETQKRRKKR